MTLLNHDSLRATKPLMIVMWLFLDVEFLLLGLFSVFLEWVWPWRSVGFFSGFDNGDQIETLETSVWFATWFNRLLKNFLLDGIWGKVRVYLSNLLMRGWKAVKNRKHTEKNPQICRKFLLNHGLAAELFPCLLKSRVTQPSCLVLAQRVQTGLAV